MAWPNPFRRNTPNSRHCWGYSFELTPTHLTSAQCEPLKHSYDVVGEQVLDRLNEISPQHNKELPRNNIRRAEKAKQGLDEKHHVDGEHEAPKNPPRDLYAILKDHAETDELLGRFWREVNTVPEWVDWDQIKRGQDVFYRYGGPNIAGLTYQALLGGMGAARVVETLARTGGFSPKVARGRLFETTQHILQCTKSLESMQPGGDGFASTIRVRLLHAAVRHRILKLTETNPDYYNVKEWGIPINDLDSIGTIASFSSTLIWLSLPRQGIFLRENEATDYIALWRYIGHVIGCPVSPFFADAENAKAMMEIMLYNEIKPNETSKIMANNIIRSLEDQPPVNASTDFLVASARWLNGNAIGDALGLPRPGLYYWALMAGQCLFFMAVCYTYRSVPYLDARKIETLKSAFWTVIVESKYGLQGKKTSFDFKYVPEYSTITEMGESQGSKLKHASVEGRNLKTLIVAVGVMGVGAYFGVKIVSGISGLIWR